MWHLPLEAIDEAYLLWRWDHHTWYFCNIELATGRRYNILMPCGDVSWDSGAPRRVYIAAVLGRVACIDVLAYVIQLVEYAK